MTEFEPCGRGICSANAGHEASCAIASGWANTAEHLAEIVRRERESCEEGVTRKGQYEPCDKTAVAVRRDEQDDLAYPVCAYHARGPMVPLADVIKAAREAS